MALPKGVVALSCCAAPLHIDRDFGLSDNIQHLVDIVAFAKSSKVFRTGGGYASVGLVTRRWEPVPSRNLLRSANETEAFEYMQSILREMECT
jgi:hypothetical protein